MVSGEALQEVREVVTGREEVRQVVAPVGILTQRVPEFPRGQGTTLLGGRCLHQLVLSCAQVSEWEDEAWFPRCF